MHSYITLFVGLSLTVCATAHAAPQYRLTDLGSSGTVSFAVGINESGQVVGHAYGNGDGSQLFLYSPSTGKQIIDAYNGNTTTFAAAISNAGHIVGTVYDLPRAFTYSQSSGYRILPSLPATPQHFGNDVNRHGVVVGEYRTSSEESRAFAFRSQDAAITPLGTLGGNQSNAYAINDAGQIVGDSNFINRGPTSPFIYSSDTGMVALTEESGKAFGINDRGQVVGYLDDGFSTFLYTPGGGLDVIADNAFAHAINNRGEVAGASYFTGEPRAFYYNGDVGAMDLNDVLDAATGEGWVLQHANDINDKGWIVGSGEFNGEARAFLLTPVPEPSSYAMMLMGLVALAGVTRKARSWRKTRPE